MTANKLTYYEKPASPLRALPENDEITVIVVYSIRYDNENIVQGWFTPDPAEQFANPYLAMGNNPVVYVDPDGEFAMILPLIVAGGIVAGSFQQASTGNNSFGQLLIGGAIGGVSAAAGFGVGSALSGVVGAGFIGGAITGAGGGFTGGFISGGGSAWYNGASLQDGMMAGLKSGGIAAASAALTGGLIGGVSAKNAGLDFLTGSKVTDLEKFGRSLGLDLTVSNDGSLGHSLANPTSGNSEEDFKQMLKAYREAKILLSQGSSFKVENLFDMESIHNSSHWKSAAINKRLYYRDLMINGEAVNVSISWTNESITDVYPISTLRNASINIQHFNGYHKSNLSSLNFINRSSDLFQRSWGHIYWDVPYNLLGPSKRFTK